MAKRPKKNPSARDKQRARERASREASKRVHPLYDQSPPYEPHRERFSVPSVAGDLIEHPARHDDRLSAGAKDMADTLVKLGPRYDGLVPLAALHLDEQLR